MTDNADQSDFREQVYAAAERADVREAVRDVYARLGQQIEQRRPLCVASGRCCRFEEYGHRLYVTTMELAAFVHELARRPMEVADNPGGCPFQAGKLCGVHAIRPFGCRIFFCDPTAQDWQQEQYEQFHAELKALHTRLEVSYLYVEWRAALAALRLTPSPLKGEGGGEGEKPDARAANRGFNLSLHTHPNPLP
jgi:Fe-S-cluster containining protein